MLKERSLTQIAPQATLRKNYQPREPMKSFIDLERMRKRAYQLIGNGRDGLFNMMDAVLTSGSISSFAELSLPCLGRNPCLSKH